MKKVTDPRLSAAELDLEDFLGEIHDEGDAIGSNGVIEFLRKEVSWQHLPEHSLLFPLAGYSLRYNLSSANHEVYLVHENEVVGCYIEIDSLIIHSEHQRKGLGPELVLAAFAQKPWNNPKRNATAAGKITLERAYRLAQLAQQGAAGDDEKTRS